MEVQLESSNNDVQIKVINELYVKQYYHIFSKNITDYHTLYPISSILYPISSIPYPIPSTLKVVPYPIQHIYIPYQHTLPNSKHTHHPLNPLPNSAHQHTLPNSAHLYTLPNSAHLYTLPNSAHLYTLPNSRIPLSKFQEHPLPMSFNYLQSYVQMPVSA